MNSLVRDTDYTATESRERFANGSTLSRERRASQFCRLSNLDAPIVGCSVLFGGRS
jgi:hypothetical protein